MASLQLIHTIKQRKLQSAESDLQAASRKLIVLQGQLNNAVQENERYHLWRIDEEKRLYARIDKKILKLVQLDELRERIAYIHEQETQRKQAVLELENAVNEAVKQKKQCQNAVVKAQKDVEKYEILIQETLEDALVLEERKSEEMLDEFASAKTEEKNSHVDISH